MHLVAGTMTAPRMTVLVTGGAGFLGCNLTRKLLELNCNVMCLDSFASGRRENIEEFRTDPRFELIRHDITERIPVECDQIYHLACPASPKAYQRNSIKTLKTAVLGTLTVLGIARRTNATVLLASTSEVYGDPLVHPQPETYTGNVNCCGPRACYDEGKRAAEALCFDYQRQHQVKVKVARIFNTYGPGMRADDGRVVSNFIDQALSKRPLTVFGDGTQSRSFCYVDDLIDGLIKLMNSDVTDLPVNLGNPYVELSVSQVAQSIAEKAGSPQSVLVFQGLPEDDPVRRRPDISRAQLLLKWEPKTDWKTGLDKTFEYFRKQKKEGSA